MPNFSQPRVAGYKPFVGDEIEYGGATHKSLVILEQLPENANCQTDVLGVGRLMK